MTSDKVSSQMAESALSPGLPNDESKDDVRLT